MSIKLINFNNLHNNWNFYIDEKHFIKKFFFLISVLKLEFFDTREILFIIIKTYCMELNDILPFINIKIETKKTTHPRMQ